MDNLGTRQHAFNADGLRSDYYNKKLAVPVSFGTSGHRGTSSNGSFQQALVLAVTQAICDYRKSAGITGTLFLGKDTHLLSVDAEQSALEVLVANGVRVVLQCGRGFCPTPVISFSILTANRAALSNSVLSDGIVITPSHNPPEDAGIKYNPPHAGPAESEITSWIEKRANQLLAGNLNEVKREAHWKTSDLVSYRDLIDVYVDALSLVVDLKAISSAKLKIGVDPLGGASIEVWDRIQERFDLGIEFLSRKIDASFSFLPPDHDGRIRMDCSSAAVMSGVVAEVKGFNLACANDTDADRHGIVDPDIGLINPNFFLALSIDYLLKARGSWPSAAMVGKTIVSSSIIESVAKKHARKIYEVPVGFKWFAQGLHNSTLCFAGEESAGACFLRFDGSPWCTDKDGIIACLLAAEIIAVEDLTLNEKLLKLIQEHFQPYYRRVDQPLTAELKARFSKVSESSLTIKELAGSAVMQVLARAPGNNASFGGLKVVTADGWFAARPSGTEPIYKLYAESYVSEKHLAQIIAEASSALEALSV